MDVQTNIEVTSLKPGDILIMEDKINHIFRHAAVVTQVDQNTKHCQVAHWRGAHYPHALTETSLPPDHIVQECNLAFHVFRLKDQNLAKRATALLQKWCLWAVPFDPKRLINAEKYSSVFFDAKVDLSNDWVPMIPNYSSPDDTLPVICNNLNQEFKKHYLDIVKYATRRDISPVRPQSKEEEQTGFFSMQGILIAFQVACVQDFVEPQNTEWFSNKETKSFKKVSEILKPDFDQDAFLNAIPPVFQLWAKLVTIDAFHHSLQNNQEHILSLGVLAPQKPELPYDYVQQEGKKVIHAYQTGLKNRTKLMEEVIVPSMKVVEIETKKQQKVTL